MHPKLLFLLMFLPAAGALVYFRLRHAWGAGPLRIGLAALWSRAGRREKTQLEKIRAVWGREIPRDRDLGAIGQYYRFVAGDHKTVDEQTWQDLAMDEVFAGIERTTSMPGRQVLYAQMRAYGAGPEVLAERTRRHNLLRQDVALRESIQLQLGRLAGRGSEYLAPLLLSPFPSAPDHAWLFRVASVLPALFVAAMMAGFPQLFLVAFACVGLNAVITLTYGQRIMPYFTGFAQIEALLGVADGLAKIDDQQALPELRDLRAALPANRRLRKRMGWLVMDRNALPDLSQGIFVLLNFFFLFDVLVFFRAISALRHDQATLVKMFEAVGSLDAAVAVASYLEERPDHCVPEFVAERRLAVTELRHPLVPGAVSNSFALAGRSAVIAGPNMAGKTCFIRTVGINLLLGQTLNFCLARTAVLPQAVVRSAIRREDKLEEGQSYFFAEIKQILEFIQIGEGGPLHFFLIDEIFRGTNTGERIASSVAVLRHLARAQLVLVTTHDSELQELLGDSFDMHHFSDRVGANGYGFDYLIRPGPARSHNAIKLLELRGYPESITREAAALAEKFQATPRVTLS